MATINLVPNIRKLTGYNAPKQDNIIHQTIYNTDRWRKLRLNYLMYNPICERCNEVLATDVHHINKIPKTDNLVLMQQIGFDENNLMSLCRECHKIKHARKN